MEENTVHSVVTSHGFNTTHKYPDLSSNDLDVLSNLLVQLYPTGRAWYMPENGVFSSFHDAINVSFLRTIQESRLLVDQTFPDNDNFSEDDANLWEYRLGLISNPDLSLELRKLNLLRKIGYPNNIRYRQTSSFIESQLQASGFDVYIHENLPPYKTPGEILSFSSQDVQHGNGLQHGNSVQHGGEGFEIIANTNAEIEDFLVGDGNLWATFFIGGPNLGDIANVRYSRLREFKELVLKLKPCHTAAFTFINFT